ncbi:MAG: transporter substrate-binding domain-containing protein [Deferribacterales bacterium]
MKWFGLLKLFLLFLVINIAYLPLYGEAKTIHVIIDNNYPPYSYIDTNGKLVGFSIDLWKLFEKKTGVEVIIEGKEWAVAQKDMNEGKYDVIDTVFRTTKREEIYDFSEPYEKVDTHIFYHKNISGINDVNTFKGFQIATKKGGATINYLYDHGFKNIKEMDSDEDIILSAKNSETTIFIVSKYTGFYYLYKYNLHRDFKIYPKPLFSNNLHRAVLKGNIEILNRVNSGFKLITDDEVDELRKKWFGEFIVKKIDYKIIFMVLIGFSVLIFVLFMSNIYLKSIVKKRTIDLELEKEKFKTIFNNSNQMMGLLDSSGKFIMINKSTYKNLNLPKGSLEGVSIKDFPLFKGKKEMEETVDKSMILIREGKQAANRLTFYVHGYGYKYYDIRMTPVMKNNELKYIIAETKDITEHIEYIRNSEQLKALQNIHLIVAGLAHDFNNLLTGIYSYISLIAEINKDPQIDEMLNNTLNAYNRAKNLVRQLQTFSKGIQLNLEEADITKVIKDVVDIAISGYKDISVEIYCKDGNIKILIDTYLISEVIENIVLNGIQSMAGKGVIKIICGIVEEDNLVYYKISITDEGSGIDEKQISKIFEPLYTTKEKGSGLGLYMAKMIIEKHGGFIRVNSVLGKGSTFEIFIPIKKG